MQPTIRFDPYAPSTDADPFPAYKALRDHAPVFWSPEARMWVLSRYDDIQRALGDWETFSSSKGNLMDELPGRAGSTLGSTDPPRHDRLRALVQSAFTKRTVEALTEPTARMAEAALDAAAGQPGFDFIDGFSSRITVGSLFLLMGLPQEDHQIIRRRVVTMIQSDPVTRQKGPEHIQAFQDMVDYVRVIVADRRAAPRDDLISRLIAAEIDGDKLAENEIVMTSMTLIMAGVESLSSFLAMFTLNLAQNPEARHRVAADPALIPQAMEESLRLNTSAQRFRRVLLRDATWHGVTMKAGDFVALMYGSGNRDERKYPEPDRYDIDRRPRDHLGFGGGVHICLGTMMARTVTRIAMGAFLARVPDFELATEKLAWNPSTTFRAPMALPLKMQVNAT
jgi:cytochrome P450